MENNGKQEWRQKMSEILCKIKILSKGYEYNFTSNLGLDYLKRGGERKGRGRQRERPDLVRKGEG